MAIIIYLLSFTGGFIIMSLELLGGRILAPYFGADIYVWGSIISVFMLALALGYLVGGRLSVHNPSLLKFSLIFTVAALLLGPLLLFMDPLLNWVFLHVEDPRYGSLIAASLLFIPATAVLGMVSPYAVRLLVMATSESGVVAGHLYFVSTMGSALGTLATSFYLVLWFEINTLIGLLTAALLTVALVGWFGDRVKI